MLFRYMSYIIMSYDNVWYMYVVTMSQTLYRILTPVTLLFNSVYLNIILSYDRNILNIILSYDRNILR